MAELVRELPVDIAETAATDRGPPARRDTAWHTDVHGQDRQQAPHGGNYCCAPTLIPEGTAEGSESYVGMNIPEGAQKVGTTPAGGARAPEPQYQFFF